MERWQLSDSCQWPGRLYCWGTCKIAYSKCRHGIQWKSRYILLSPSVSHFMPKLVNGILSNDIAMLLSKRLLYCPRWKRCFGKSNYKFFQSNKNTMKAFEKSCSWKGSKLQVEPEFHLVFLFLYFWLFVCFIWKNGMTNTIILGQHCNQQGKEILARARARLSSKVLRHFGWMGRERLSVYNTYTYLNWHTISTVELAFKQICLDGLLKIITINQINLPQ